MLCMDQWDWKTNAPEFVPGSGGLPGMAAGPGGMAAGPGGSVLSNWQGGEAPAPGEAMGATMCGNPCGSSASAAPTGPGISPCAAPGGPVMGGAYMPPPGPMHGQAMQGAMPCLSDFSGGQFPGAFVGQCQAPCGQQMGPQMQGLLGGGSCMGSQHGALGMQGMEFSQQPMMQGAGSAYSSRAPPEDHAARIRAAQQQARYEMQLKSKDQELKDLQERLFREEGERAQMQAVFERDRQGLLHNLNKLSHAMAEKERKGHTSERHDRSERHHASGEERHSRKTSNPLDSKMEQLNSLLSRGGREAVPKAGQSHGSEAEQRRGAMRSALSARTLEGASRRSNSRHRVTFPDDKELATTGLDSETLQFISRLEHQTGGFVDTPTRQLLESLGPEGAWYALQKTRDALQVDGGRCKNLSSAIQSTCRRAKERSRRSGHDSAATRESAQQSSEAAAQRRGVERIAPTKPQPAAGTQWSASRFEKFVKQTPGAFELRQQQAPDGTSWLLRLRMDELSPPLNDEGMQVYCRWLHQALLRAREEHGIRSLRQVRAEVMFAWNAMGDDAVGRLLQALQRSELRVTCLNFSGNCLGPQGALHISEFIQESSFCVLEVNLSHNQLDADVALDLVSLFSEHPKYPPPRRSGGSKGFDSVRLLLGNNGIHNPAKVLRRLDGLSGLTLQSGHGRHGVRDWNVLKLGSPLLCLPAFEAQEAQEAWQPEVESHERAPLPGRPATGTLWKPPPATGAAPEKGGKPQPVGPQPVGLQPVGPVGVRQPPTTPPPRGEAQAPEPEQTPEPNTSAAKKQAWPDEKEGVRREWKVSDLSRAQPKATLNKPAVLEKQMKASPAVERKLHVGEEHKDEADDEEALKLDDSSKAPGAEADPTPPPPPVKLTAPPKILQRGSPPAQ
eukprot:TRINITY_DN5997_c0_g1_i1.p1 TRINITY_DN5997_c0_g1~~TRINITY_DN5997_c0_g1_i1.p1  ORF type:complete len:900 (-),score=213.70 TRINITY_DN5997_c0_g1_i1:113-2812(-)